LTFLEVDAVVNAANEGLLGGGGIDEAIHKAAGPLLQRECASLNRLCLAGQAVLTKGYLLPATYVLHTVGPYLDEQNQPQPKVLADCYRNCLRLARRHNIRTIAFPAISTGFYGHDVFLAARVAIETCVDECEKHKEFRFDRIIFVAFGGAGLKPYEKAFERVIVGDGDA
jgi:O-acetyl-ADP-ribose deacetylase (regulator of RNase III)